MMLLINYRLNAPRLLMSILAFSMLVALTLFNSSAYAQQAVSNPAPVTYDDWQKTCSTPPGTPNTLCELTQIVRSKERPDMSFRLSFIKLPQKKGTLLRLIVPIRVELPRGVSVNIDGQTDIGNMVYRRCIGENCIAEAVLDEKNIQNFLNANEATFFVYPSPEEGVGGIFSLKGLKAGYNALP